MKKSSSTRLRQRVVEVVKRVGLVNQDHPSELSDGEQPRVAIAQAIVYQPQVLLADEPTGNLNSYQEAEIVLLLQGLAQRAGQTGILVTHSEAAARVME